MVTVASGYEYSKRSDSRQEGKGESTRERRGNGESIHLAAGPLHLLEDVERAMHDELVHGPRLVGEVRRAVAALLRRAELVLEEGVVLGADYHKIVRHGDSGLLGTWWQGWVFDLCAGHLPRGRQVLQVDPWASG